MKLDTGGRDSKYVVFALIFMVSNKLQTIGDAFFKEVSAKQWFVLLALMILGEQPPTLTELSEMVGSSHQNVKQLVLKLEQKGYVELMKDEEDARRLRIKTTAKCFELDKAYEGKNAEFLTRLFGQFDVTDMAVMERVLLSMREVLEGMENDYVKE